MSLVDVGNLIGLELGEQLRQLAHRLVVVRLRQKIERFGDGCPSALGIFGHHVQPFAIVLILHLAEWFHASVQIVVDNGIAVFAVVEGLPAAGREREGLGVVADVERRLQGFGASLGRHGVEVPADDEVGVIGHDRRQVVVDGFGAKLQFVELLKAEVAVAIACGKGGGRVGGVVDGACGTHREGALQLVVGLVVFLHGEVERAGDALRAAEVQLRPLVLVDKLSEHLLQIVEHRCTGALHLLMIDRDAGVEFLRCRGRTEQAGTSQEEEEKCFCHR